MSRIGEAAAGACCLVTRAMIVAVACLGTVRSPVAKLALVTLGGEASTVFTAQALTGSFIASDVERAVGGLAVGD